MTGARAFGGLWVALGTLGTFAMMALVSLLPLTQQRALLAEGGPFETLSALGYGVCIALMLWLWPRGEVTRRWYFAVIFLLFAGRELDLDKIPFTEGLLKARQYTGDTVPTGELIISALILLAILATVAILLLRETRGFIAGLMRARPACFATLIGLMFIGVYKLIDGLARKLEPFGITLGEALNNTLTVVEEIGELGIPIMFGIAIFLSSSALTHTRMLGATQAPND